jgi:hypothetical protein
LHPRGEIKKIYFAMDESKEKKLQGEKHNSHRLQEGINLFTLKKIQFSQMKQTISFF